MRAASLLTLCVFMASSGCQIPGERIETSATAAAWQREETLSGVRLRLPPEAVVKVQEGPDFRVYNIFLEPGTRHLFGLYAGGFPDLKTFDGAPGYARHILLNGAKTQEKHWTSKGLVSRQLLIRSRNDDYAAFYHVYYSALIPPDGTIADDIISSMCTDLPSKTNSPQQ